MATAQQYLGSKLSLVSKACIRYEGILHSIDPVAATLTLATVRMLGTEHRRPEAPVQPTDKIYGYICFKGSDLKDIYMCEDPKKNVCDIPDPAILEQSEVVNNLGSTANSGTSSVGNPTPLGAGIATQDLSHLTANKKNPSNFYGNTFGTNLSSNPPNTFYGAAGINYNALSGHNISQKTSPTSDQGTQMTPLNKNYNKAPGSNIGAIGQQRNQRHVSTINQPPQMSYSGYNRYNQANVNSNTTGHHISNQRYGMNGPSSNSNYDTLGYHAQPNHFTNHHNLSAYPIATGINNRNNSNLPSAYNHQQPYSGHHQSQQQQQHPIGTGRNFNQTSGPTSNRQGGMLVPSNYGNFGTRNMNNMTQHTNPHYSSHHNYRSMSNQQHQTHQMSQNLKEEFDFEGENAKFNKESLSKEFEEKLKLVLTSEGAGDERRAIDAKVDGVDHHLLEDLENNQSIHDNDSSSADNETPDGNKEALMYYEPKKSFFDNISCQTNMEQKKRILNKLTAAIEKRDDKDDTKDKEGKAKYFGTANRGRGGGYNSSRRPNDSETFGVRQGYSSGGGGGYYQNYGSNTSRFNSNYNYRNFGNNNNRGFQNYRNNYPRNNQNSSSNNANLANPTSTNPIKVGGPN